MSDDVTSPEYAAKLTFEALLYLKNNDTTTFNQLDLTLVDKDFIKKLLPPYKGRGSSTPPRSYCKNAYMIGEWNMLGKRDQVKIIDSINNDSTTNTSIKPVARQTTNSRCLRSNSCNDIADNTQYDDFDFNTASSPSTFHNEVDISMPLRPDNEQVPNPVRNLHVRFEDKDVLNACTGIDRPS